MFELATGVIKGQVGETFTVGKLGEYTVQDDPNLGLPFIYNSAVSDADGRSGRSFDEGLT